MHSIIPPISRLSILALSLVCFSAGLAIKGFFTVRHYRRQRTAVFFSCLIGGIIGLWTAGSHQNNSILLTAEHYLIEGMLSIGKTTGTWIDLHQEWIKLGCLCLIVVLTALVGLKKKGRSVPFLLLIFSAGASLLGSVTLGKGEIGLGTYFLGAAVLYAWVYGLTSRKMFSHPPSGPPRVWPGYSLLALIIILGFLLRIHNLGEVSFRFDHYETDYAQQAFRVLNGRHDIRLWQRTGWRGLGHPNLSPVYSYCVALSFYLFDASIFSLKLVAIFYGTAALLFVYGIFKILFNRRLALLVTFLLAVSPMHINYSRIGLLLVSTQTVSLMIVYLLIRCLRGDRTYVYVLLGTVVSFAAYFYSPAKYPILISAVLIAAYSLFQRRFLRRNFLKVLTLVLTILLITIAFNIPTWGLIAPRFDGYESVWHRTRSHVHTPEADYIRALPLVWENFVRLTENFFIRRNFNYNPWPSGNLYFNPFVSIMFLTGVAISLANIKQGNYRLLLFFTAAFVIPNLLSRPPVVVRRMMVSWPFIYCLAAIPVCRLLEEIRRLFSRPARAGLSALVVVSLLSLGTYKTHIFFDSDQPAGRWEEERYLNEYAKGLLDDYLLFLSPINERGWQTADFILGQKTRKGQGEYRFIRPLNNFAFSRVDLPSGRNVAFIYGYPHANRSDLENLRRRLGGGRIEEVKTRFGRIVGHALLIEPADLVGETDYAPE